VAWACPTAIARYGTAQLGADKLRAAAGGFGFGAPNTLLGDATNAMGVEGSTLGPFGSAGGADPVALAQSCLGQRDVRMTPLDGALLAAAVANEGRQMRPYVVAARRDRTGGTVFQAEPAELRRSVPKEVAAQLATLMVAAVTDGIARTAAVPGATIGGLAAAPAASERGSHGWFIGYAVRNGVPVAATAVFIEDAESSGARDAAGIGRRVLQAALAAGK
jgi:peptidoglycan glycosyltransferase